MLWVVQKNLFYEKEYNTFTDTIVKSGVPYQPVTVIPFSHEMIPIVEYQGKKVAYGSTTMMRITIKDGWNPGCYYDEEKFNAKVWLREYGVNCLNNDAVICQLKDVPEDMSAFFIRPCDDLKLFTGAVMNKEDFLDWKNRIVNADSVMTVTGDTWVYFAELKLILREYRFFVVDGKIVTGSTYKIGTRVTYDLPVEQGAQDFAMCMISIWQPHRVFVIDIAETPAGYRVVEINCANSAGFYNCDMSKFVQAVNELEGS
jgi:hypothetical protein